MKEDGEQKADDKGQRSEGKSQRSENMEAGMWKAERSKGGLNAQR